METKLVCEKCGYSTHVKHNMMKHIKVFMCGELECNICKKKFKTGTNLPRHIKACIESTFDGQVEIESEYDSSCEFYKKKMVDVEMQLMKYMKAMTIYKNIIHDLENQLKCKNIVSKPSASGYKSELVINTNMPKLSEIIITDLSYITKERYIEIAKSTNPLATLIIDIFFNANNTNNHTIFMNKQKSPVVFILVGNVWNTYDSKKLPLLLIELAQYLSEKSGISLANLEQLLQEYYAIPNESTAYDKRIEPVRKLITGVCRTLMNYNQYPIKKSNIKGMRKRKEAKS